MKKSPGSTTQRLMIHNSNSKKLGSKISLASENLHFVEHERKIGELSSAVEQLTEKFDQFQLDIDDMKKKVDKADVALKQQQQVVEADSSYA